MLTYIQSNSTKNPFRYHKLVPELFQVTPQHLHNIPVLPRLEGIELLIMVLYDTYRTKGVWIGAMVDALIEYDRSIVSAIFDDIYMNRTTFLSHLNDRTRRFVIISRLLESLEKSILANHKKATFLFILVNLLSRRELSITSQHNKYRSAYLSIIPQYLLPLGNTLLSGKQGKARSLLSVIRRINWISKCQPTGGELIFKELPVLGQLIGLYWVCHLSGIINLSAMSSVILRPRLITNVNNLFIADE